VYLQGKRGEVVAASGPWRSSGDWWQEDSWCQDEWDLEIVFPSAVAAQLYPEHSRGNAVPVRSRRRLEQTHPFPQHDKEPQRGLYRIYFDTLKQAWFLRGEYD
jgi:hypothetical protein